MFFNGVTPSNTPVLVEIVKCSLATNANNGQQVTPVQWRGQGNTSGAGLTAQLSAYAGYVSEPTVETTLEPLWVPPTTGLVLPLALGDEPEVIASASMGIGIRVTPAQTVSCLAYMRFVQGVT